MGRIPPLDPRPPRLATVVVATDTVGDCGSFICLPLSRSDSDACRSVDQIALPILPDDAPRICWHTILTCGNPQWYGKPLKQRGLLSRTRRRTIVTQWRRDATSFLTSTGIPDEAESFCCAAGGRGGARHLA